MPGQVEIEKSEDFSEASLYQKRRIFNKVVNDRIEEEVKYYEKQGFIEDANDSKYAANVVPVFKNGKFRMAIDYKNANKNIKTSHFPLPTRQELLAATRGVNFSALWISEKVFIF